MEDEGDNLQPRPRDDMLNRRLGNVPAPLRKKKLEEHKKFITPSGDPLSYIKQQRMREKLDREKTQREKAWQKLEAKFELLSAGDSSEQGNKSTSNLDTTGLKDQQERNERYEQLQTLKQQLREEEETWTSKLQDWKSRRRSVTSTLRERKEDREHVEKMTSSRQLRRHKTYAEMLEDKKRREESFDASTTSSASSTTGQEAPVAPPRYSTSQKLDADVTTAVGGQQQRSKQLYRGAKSSPMLNVDIVSDNHHHHNNNHTNNNNNNKKNVTSSSSSSSSESEDEYEKAMSRAPTAGTTAGKRSPLIRQSQVTYTSKTVVMPVKKKDDDEPAPTTTTTTHQSPPIYKSISPRYAPRQSASLPRGASLSSAPSWQRRDLSPQKSSPTTTSAAAVVENHHRSPTTSSQVTSPSRAPQVEKKQTTAVTSVATVVQPNTSSPAYRVVMRRKNNNNNNNSGGSGSTQTLNRARPKSAYSVLDSASTNTTSTTSGSGLPSNYHEYSSPKPYGTSRFVQYRKSMFASKRNLWENRSVDSSSSATNHQAPKPLSALLQQDTERLSQNLPENNSSSPPTTTTTSTNNNNNNNNSSSSSWRRPSTDMPKYGSSMRSQTLPRQWSRKPSTSTAATNPNTNGNKITAKSTTIEPVSPTPAPVVKSPVAKKITMTTAPPAATKSTPPPSYQSPPRSSPINEKKSPRELEAPVPAATAPRVDVAVPPSSTAEDMKICIIQKPRSAKGFGFTVRGGDDGKPVIVDTVNPGGAADICQLCVGDEILAINDVQLVSLKTQDGIVQLIVDSIITGNLALNIRRFQKAKKASPLRLTGTKVVMTSGGFVSVRSDRNFTGRMEKVISPPVTVQQDEEMKPPTPPPPPPLDEDEEDFPPPPEELLSPPPVDDDVPVVPVKRSVHQSRFFAQATMRKSIDDLTLNNNHHEPEKEIDDEKVAWRENDNFPSDDDEVMTSSSCDEADELEREMQEVKRQLETEHSFVPNSVAPSSGNNGAGDYYSPPPPQQSVAPPVASIRPTTPFKQKLLDDQRRLEEEEMRREQHRRMLAQQAHEEEQQVQMQLRKIEMQKQETTRRREMEKQRLMDSNFAYSGLRTKTSSITSQGQFRHWLLDEAERSRLAEGEGRQRTTALEPTTNNNQQQQHQQTNSGVLPAHVIQRLTQHHAPPRGGNDEMNGCSSGSDIGYSPHATLL